MAETKPQILHASLSPQERFQLSGDNISKHRQLVDTNEFSRGADFAMLQFQVDLVKRENNPTVIGLKLAGAQDYLRLFKLLSERPVLREIPKVQDNLQPTN